MLIPYKIGIDPPYNLPTVGQLVSFTSWNFYLISGFTNRTILINPGIVKGPNSFAFIQIVEGNSRELFLFKFPAKDFSYNKKNQEITIRNNCFSPDHLTFDLFDAANRVSGHLNFKGTPLRTQKFQPFRTWFFPKSFKQIPLTRPCKTKGNIVLNEEAYVFTDALTLLQKKESSISPAAWLHISGCDFYTSIQSFSISICKEKNNLFSPPRICGYLRTLDQEYYIHSIPESSIDLFRYTGDLLVFQLYTKKFTLRVMVEFFHKINYFQPVDAAKQQGKLTTEALIFLTLTPHGEKALKDYSKNGLIEQTGNISLLSTQKD